MKQDIHSLPSDMR